MFVEKNNTPLSSLKSSVGATCFGGRFFRRGDTHVAPTELAEGIFLTFPVLHTCHSYGVYEEYFMLTAQVEIFLCVLRVSVAEIYIKAGVNLASKYMSSSPAITLWGLFAGMTTDVPAR
jgi:hypothetical protein